MTMTQWLLAGTGIAAIATIVADRPITRHSAAVIAGAIAVAAWWIGRGAVSLGLVVAGVPAVAGARLAMLLLARGRLRFTAEEQRMREAGLAGLDPSQARHLIDQGIWIDGKPGETLIREGAAVSHLFFLIAGTAEVTVHAIRIAAVPAPAFLGEITVLDESGATATVALPQGGRFWCVEAGALRVFLRENPAIRVALADCFVGTLAQKLRQSNAARVGATPG